jgi:hypothetical protein
MYLGYSWLQIAQLLIGSLGCFITALRQGFLAFLGVSLNVIGIGGLGSGVGATQKKEDERTAKNSSGGTDHECEFTLGKRLLEAVLPVKKSKLLTSEVAKSILKIAENGIDGRDGRPARPTDMRGTGEDARRSISQATRLL